MDNDNPERKPRFAGWGYRVDEHDLFQVFLFGIILSVLVLVLSLWSGQSMFSIDVAATIASLFLFVCLLIMLKRGGMRPPAKPPPVS